MASLTVELVSVERLMWSGEASIVVAQTTEGEIGVLPGHEPVLAELGASGTVVIRPIEGDALVAAVQGGFLSVSKEKVTILAEYAVWAHEVDISKAQALVDAEGGTQKAWGEAELLAVRRSERV
ncbi:MAG: F0F1 ATP synthase subunit epsilon [Corynebacterium sp.]|nr:F0F1 ATP synthase subunit epsilon [Corynebacterium sp.]